jgi:hypothetical protein
VSAITGTVTAYYLFEVAETVRLASLEAAIGPTATRATLYDKAPGAPRLRYVQPPVVVNGADLGEPTIGAFTVRIKFYEYGVVSLALARPFEGSWPDLLAIGQDLIENESLQAQAEAACRRVILGLAAHFDGARSAFLDEDYLVFAVTNVEPPVSAEAVLAEHADDIAQLLRGERQRLSSQERDETVRHRLSYLSDDLVIPAWNAAFVYDRESAVAGTVEILEFANSQLLEYRYHDERLETSLGRIYTSVQHPRWTDAIIGRRSLRATRELHGLFIDVNELADRSENALKLAGDVYSARLFNLTAARLGLDQWKRNVESKLKTLDDIYRFSVEQTRVSQGNMLELVIVLILVFELGLTLRELLGWS